MNPRMIVSNAIPAAMIGVGVYMLVRPEATSMATSRVRDLANFRDSESLDLLTTNPMISGLAAFALGAIAGALIPETQKEHELLGETRDRLTQRAKDAARERVRDLTSSVTDAIKGKKTDVGENVGVSPSYNG